jgi:hypothetical protein
MHKNDINQPIFLTSFVYNYAISPLNMTFVITFLTQIFHFYACIFTSPYQEETN